MANIVLAALSTGIEGGFSVIYDIPQDLWDRVSQVFDKSNVNKLLWHISGDSTATVDNMAPIEALAAGRMTSADMIANYNKVNPASADEDLSASANFKSANEDYSISAMSNDAEIIITLGGLKWTPVFLSTTNEGKDNEPHDVILTLWLTDNEQDAWVDRAADEDDCYGFLDGGLYGVWSGYYDISDQQEYPSNMYGTSYMSAVILNNGGVYAKTRTQTTTVEQNKDSVFAAFTMPEFGLTQYIVTPEHVSWQESGQSAKNQISGISSYNCPNENWANNKEQVPDTDFYNNGEFNYAGKDGNDSWKDDYLWLPSISETGNDSTFNGIWKTTVSQRALRFVTNEQSGWYITMGEVGKTSSGSGRTAHHCSWLRTGTNEVDKAYVMYDSGRATISSDPHTADCCAVRPALHLNLTAVAKSLKN